MFYELVKSSCDFADLINIFRCARWFTQKSLLILLNTVYYPSSVTGTEKCFGVANDSGWYSSIDILIKSIYQYLYLEANFNRDLMTGWAPTSHAADVYTMRQASIGEVKGQFCFAIHRRIVAFIYDLKYIFQIHKITHFRSIILNNFVKNWFFFKY